MLSRMRVQSGLPEEQRLFYFHIFESVLTRMGAPNLMELFRLGGTGAWGRLRDRARVRHPYASQMFGSMAKIMELNENEAGGWLTAPLVGHGSSPEIFAISMADGLMLEQAGMTCVKQLFKTDDLTGRLLVGENCGYEGVPPNIANKCRVLRMRLCALGKRVREVPEGTFCQLVQETKMSQLYRRMHRQHVDGLLPGPPSYFTRRKDGIPVPSLADFMKGYDNPKPLRHPFFSSTGRFGLMLRRH
jgi:hypothetical protein